ncbi:MAG TPA: D-tyrosyl-tRNA(Tyr) deacylase [Dehalococcoidia bacterium]|jgi:D-tyrosyl-tRNA(Tyr) deacylase|nr:D-tyrosyl-tRNA(Tyr) deacylase [Dehalococcoidia bacterium]HIK88458.1 D-tyrosyl-tRNA(Tyr) deacylase [Dehalococcoidia bacterium]
MRAVIQRVNRASVTVDDEVTGSIDRGLCLLIGITHEDTEDDLKYIVDKTLNMRIFPDPNGDSGFDESVQDIGGGLLLISQFTLYATTRKGRRPGFTEAARPEIAQPMFDQLIDAFRFSGLRVQTGVFGAMMNVEIENAGPMTIMLDSADRNAPRRG